MNRSNHLPPRFSLDAHGALVFDGFGCDDLVEGKRTPLYVYSAAQIRDNYFRMCAAFDEHLRAPWRVFYAYKGNPSPAICRLLHMEGAGAEIVSRGELLQALELGVAPENIVFNNVVKTEEDLTLAVKCGVGLIVLDSETEVDLLGRIAADHGVRIDVGVRLRPGISAGFHQHVRTGDSSTKFGFTRETIKEVILPKVRTASALRLRAVHVHLGSQINDLEVFDQAAAGAIEFAKYVRDTCGFPMDIVDLGGGMGIQDDLGSPVDFDFQGLAVRVQTFLERVFGPNPLEWPTLYFEPNRALVGNAGILLGRIVSLKRDVGRRFVGTDTGFSAFARPMVYGAVHRVCSAKNPFPREPVQCDILGPLCESGDVLARAVGLAKPTLGDVLVVFDTGAYGYAQASRYNSLPLPGERLLDGGIDYEIREPEQYPELNRLARIPKHLATGAQAADDPRSARPASVTRTEAIVTRSADRMWD